MMYRVVLIVHILIALNQQASHEILFSSFQRKRQFLCMLMFYTCNRSIQVGLSKRGLYCNHDHTELGKNAVTQIIYGHYSMLLMYAS